MGHSPGDPKARGLDHTTGHAEQSEKEEAYGMVVQAGLASYGNADIDRHRKSAR